MCDDDFLMFCVEMQLDRGVRMELYRSIPTWWLEGKLISVAHLLETAAIFRYSNNGSRKRPAQSIWRADRALTRAGLCSYTRNIDNILTQVQLSAHFVGRDPCHLKIHSSERRGHANARALEEALQPNFTESNDAFGGGRKEKNKR